MAGLLPTAERACTLSRITTVLPSAKKKIAKRSQTSKVLAWDLVSQIYTIVRTLLGNLARESLCRRLLRLGLLLIGRVLQIQSTMSMQVTSSCSGLAKR